MFSADEVLAGRALNRGVELCSVVEQMYSLYHVFKASGDLSLLDRVELIAYNALPATISADLWRHQYLQQANEISACKTNPHVWQSDGPDSTMFGVEPNFGCCTANFNQGWPKLAAAALHTKPSDGGLVVALLLPVAATLPDGAKITVDTNYPLDDTVDVTLTVPSSGAATPLYVRVPGWADNATYSVGDGASQPAANGTFLSTTCAAGAAVTLHLALHPTIRVETGWGGAVGRRTNPAPNTTAGGYSVWTGSMPAGGDVHVANMTIAQAEAWCNSSAACIGFTTRATSQELAALPAIVEEEAAHVEHRHSPDRDPQRSPDHQPHDHQDHDPHDHHGSHRHDADLARRRAAAQTPPPAPPLPPGPVPNPPPTGLYEVYFKAAFNPNTDRRWKSYVKVFDVMDTNAASVMRGPLLYALRLKQDVKTIRAWQPFGNTDVNITTPSQWRYALLLNASDMQSQRNLKFERTGATGGVAFNSSAVSLVIHAPAVALGDWRAVLDAADEPPPSPLQLKPAAGAVEHVELVPYGATELRMGALPWAAL